MVVAEGDVAGRKDPFVVLLLSLLSDFAVSELQVVRVAACDSW